MCGRFALTIDQLLKYIEYRKAQGQPHGFTSRWNIAPGQETFVFYQERDKKIVAPMRWGLVPPWAKDESIGHKMINARAETIAGKPSFRKPLQQKRCIVPMSGFYEWVKEENTKKKQAYYFQHKDQMVLPVAGLYETWKNPEGKELKTFTVITTEANQMMQPYHERMPVILDEKSVDAWLNPETKDPHSILKQPKDILKAYPVSDAVNKPGNEGPDLIKPDLH